MAGALPWLVTALQVSPPGPAHLPDQGLAAWGLALRLLEPLLQGVCGLQNGGEGLAHTHTQTHTDTHTHTQTQRHTHTHTHTDTDTKNKY